jgi:hypothetical protein
MTTGSIIVAATLATGILSFSAVGAMAAVVCNDNVCWHAKERYDYPPAAGVIVHEDDWRPGPDIVIRDHEGRGYWKGDAWVDF